MIHNILQVGHNCWKKVEADRVALLIDGSAYYDALVQTISRAEESLLMLGWDFDFRTEMHGKDTEKLGDVLLQAVRNHRRLQIHVLEWDFAMIYAFERGLIPLFGMGCPSHRRIHFRRDEKHPIGASHHQKIIVVDDNVAFVGGLDVTKQRWDTPAHRANDPGRVNPDGKPYGPFHDVQMMVQGEVAGYLGALCRTRWKGASGRKITRPTIRKNVWPPSVSADLSGIVIGIARTQPSADTKQETREIQNFYRDAIAAAEHSIYIESQYMTASCVRDSLEASLKNPRGPEVVIVVPEASLGWMEENTMDIMRGRLIHRLKQCDLHKRLQVLYPVVGNHSVFVHSKLIIIDNNVISVGSANLSNRSMGYDTECNLVLESSGKHQIQKAIEVMKNRLLAEHLGTPVREIEECFLAKGSLIQTVQSFPEGTRNLLPVQIPAELTLIPDPDLVDPERPIDLERWIMDFIPNREFKAEARGDLLRIATFFFSVILISVIWNWTPAGAYLNSYFPVGAMKAILQSRLTPFAILLGFQIGTLVLLPFSILVFAAASLFGPLTGFGYAMGGGALSAAITYWIGKGLGRNTVRRLARKKLNRVSHLIARKGMITLIIVRILPIAPFVIVNMIAGVSRIRFRDFLIGSVMGMIPGVLAITLFESGLEAAISKRDPISITIVLILSLGLILAVIGLQGWLGKREPRWKQAEQRGH